MQRAQKQPGGGGKGGNDGGGRDVAAHNWDNVLAKYRNGQAAKEVIDEFAAAGYHGGAQRAAILKAMNSDKWGKKVIAHSLGGNDSGLRAGTDKRIQDCKTKLIAWARKNQAASQSKSAASSASARGPRRGAADDEAEERAYFNTIQRAKWAKDGDADAMKTLADWANEGNELAWQKLVEMARSGIANAVDELSRLATQGNDRAWAIVLREFQVHTPGSSGGALPVGYTPPPPFDMRALYEGRIRINHDPWEHVQGVDPAEWDE